MLFSHVIDLANDSGGTLYIMVVLLTLALAVIIERSRYLSNMLENGDHLIKLLKSKKKKDHETLSEFSAKHPELPHLNLITVAVEFPNNDKNRDHMNSSLEEAIMHEIPKLDRSLWVLDTIITLAPLLGLFGTIFGMFNSFSVMSDNQNVSSQITSGIAEALIATASGLVVAMLGLIFFNSLNTRIKLVIHQLETLKIMLMNRSNKAIHSNVYS